VHHRAFGRTACERPDDRRDPKVSTWRDVNCRRCLEAGFVEVVVGTWKVYAPEANGERVLLLLPSASRP
jgi:hypothetical protein